MFRKFAIAAAATAAIAIAGTAAMPERAEAKTVVNLGIGIGLPGYYGGGYYGGGYYAPGYYYGPAPVYYVPRHRVRCHRHHRRVRVWSPRRGRYVWRTIRGPRHCHRYRAW